MAASAGLRRVGAEAERGLRDEGGDWSAASGAGRGAFFTFSLPGAPSLPSHSTPPRLPVSLGNLQLKASHPHGNMYPSNKKKKVWREEKGNWPGESWGCGCGWGWMWGGGGGQGCVCRGGPRPSSRLAPARPVPPPSRVRVYTHAHARSHRRARAAPGHLRLARGWAHAPRCRRPRPVGRLAGRGCLRLPGGVDARAAVPGPAQLPPVAQPVSTLLPGLSHAWPACPADTCPRADTPAAAAAAPPRPRAPSLTLGLCPCPPPSACTVSPPWGVYPFSRSPTLRRRVT